ncbi:MAG: cytochrome-c oxidase, cbb3-type subunit III [Betaproteobacteria bacterium]
MSDFVSEFWHYYVVGIVLASVIACAVLLWMQGAAEVTQGKTMGHVWDEDLEEYNNPLPKWWSWLFYITVVFALVYLTLYPGLGRFPGVLGWCSHADPGCVDSQYKKEMEKVDADLKPMFDKYIQMDFKAVVADPQARDMGKRLFMTYCMQCHGADAKGSKGFPNLSDNDWLYGGEPEKIIETISNGRMGVMPPYGGNPDAIGGAAGAKEVATYVRSLSGMYGDPVLVAKGKEKFAAVCVACHGQDAKGMTAVGAPNLTDKIWLYGSSEATIVETITKGRNNPEQSQNRMPAWKDFLGEGKVKLLAAYVYGLSHPDKK